MDAKLGDTAAHGLHVAEKTSLILKTRYGLTDLKIVHTRHGAGDRAIGFNPESAKFDLVLVSGPKIRDRLIAEAGLTPDQIALVGYPKFEAADAARRVGVMPVTKRDADGKVWLEKHDEADQDPHGSSPLLFPRDAAFVAPPVRARKHYSCAIMDGCAHAMGATRR